jgi:hypothetical protein
MSAEQSGTMLDSINNQLKTNRIRS